MQYYVPLMDNHVFRLTAITHRHDPVLQAIHAGSMEDVNLLGISREAQLLSAVQATGARVRAARFLPSILDGAISIEQRYAGEAKGMGVVGVHADRWLQFLVGV